MKTANEFKLTRAEKRAMKARKGAEKSVTNRAIVQGVQLPENRKGKKLSISPTAAYHYDIAVSRGEKNAFRKGTRVSHRKGERAAVEAQLQAILKDSKWFRTYMFQTKNKFFELDKKDFCAAQNHEWFGRQSFKTISNAEYSQLKNLFLKWEELSGKEHYQV